MFQYPYGSMSNNNLITVRTIDDVRALQSLPNSRFAAFEDNDDIFYFVETDANNNKSIRRFRFQEEPIESVYDKRYATKDEINELKEMINNVQQSIQTLSIGNNTDVSKQRNSSNKANG
jgi:hypothetical protein